MRASLHRAVCPHNVPLHSAARTFIGSSSWVGCSSERFPELSIVAPPNSGAGRSVTDMDHSWLTGAAAALVIVLGPSTTSTPASAAPITAGSGATANTTASAAVITSASRGNVIAVVPGASIADGDHLPSKLDLHHSYRAVFVVWVAPNARRPSLKIHANGGPLRRCSVLKLQPGTDSFLTCEVTPDSARQGATNLTITLVARTSNLGTYSRSFRHSVTK